MVLQDNSNHVERTIDAIFAMEVNGETGNQQVPSR